jgi:hypothetical protein
MTAVDSGSVPAGTGTEPHDVPTRREWVRRNGVWLVLPVLVVNIVLAGALPEGYGSDEGVPGWLLAVEWVLRVVVFAAPVLMVVTLQGRAGRFGMVVYVLGLALYAASWAVVIAAGDAGVGNPVAATAPYWTPAVFLSGVALLCRRWWYLVPVGLFVAAHTGHGLLSLGLV